MQQKSPFTIDSTISKFLEVKSILWLSQEPESDSILSLPREPSFEFWPYCREQHFIHFPQPREPLVFRANKDFRANSMMHEMLKGAEIYDTEMTSAPETPTDAASSRLFSLPPEICLEIYSYAPHTQYRTHAVTVHITYIDLRKHVLVRDWICGRGWGRGIQTSSRPTNKSIKKRKKSSTPKIRLMLFLDHKGWMCR